MVVWMAAMRVVLWVVVRAVVVFVCLWHGNLAEISIKLPRGARSRPALTANKKAPRGRGLS
jgi:hypothetical protein